MRTILVGCILLPTSAIAEVCDKERPLWDGTPATAWTELINLMTSPIQVALVVATILAIWTGTRIGCGILTLVWAAFIPMMLTRDLDDMIWEASREGCIGSPILFMGLCAAICSATLYATLRPRSSQT